MTIMPKKKKPAPKKPVAKRPAALRSKPTAKPTAKPSAKARPVKKTVRAARPAAAVAPDRVAAFREAILRHLKSTFARDPVTATRNDWWSATCMAVRDQILERYIDTQTEHAAKNVRRVYYLSLEYLMGRVLSNNLVNLGLRDVASHALAELGQDLETCLLYTSPSPRDRQKSRMPSSA